MSQQPIRKPPSPHLSQAGINKIKSIIKKATTDAKRDIPGISISIRNTKGQELLSYASGKVGSESDEDLTVDNQFWIASCTKLLTTVAALQLVEQGKLGLDDGAQIESLIPELQSLTVMVKDEQGKIRLVPKKNKITLRHLLTHTAGFGYNFFNANVKEYLRENKIKGWKLSEELHYITPLLFEPGTQFNYGVGIDVAGLAVERCTGLKLGEYIKKNVYDPLGLKFSTFNQDDQSTSKLIKLNLRDDEGNIREIPHVYTANLSEKESFFHSGGGGSFSTPSEYSHFLATLINNGTSPITGNTILKPSTADSLFINQLQQFPNLGRNKLQGIKNITPLRFDEFFPQEGNPPQGWGFSFLLSLVDVRTGRSKGSAHWYGLPNWFYWLDKTTGIVGVVGMQLFPFLDQKAYDTWIDIETAVYENLIDQSSPKL